MPCQRPTRVKGGWSRLGGTRPKSGAIIMSRRKLTFWEKALLLGLASWGLLVIVPDSKRVFVDYSTLGFQADNNGKIYYVDESSANYLDDPTAKDSRLQKGERIDLSRTHLSNLLAVFGGMGGMQYVRPDLKVELYIKSRPDGVNLKALPAPLDLLARFLLFLETFFGIAFIFCGARMVWKCPNAVTWGFFLYAIWFNPGQYFVYYAELQRWPNLVLLQEILQSIFQSAGYAGFVIFALRFPHNVIDDRWRRVERAMPFVAIVLALLQLCSFGTAVGLQTEGVTRASYIAGLAIDLLVLWILWERQRTQTPEDRQRTRWVLWLGGFGLLAFVLADSYEATSLFSRHWQIDETTLSIFYLLNATLLVAVVYAIQRYRVIDVTFALSRATTRLITWLFILAMIAVPAYFIHEWMHNAFHTAVVLLPLFLLLTFTEHALHQWLNEACDRLFFRSLHRAEKRLRDFEAMFGKAESCDSVDRVLVDEPVALLALASAAVFRKEENATFRRVRAMGWGAENTSEIASDKPLIHELMRMKKPIRLEEGDDLLDGIPPGLAKPAVAVPVITRSGLSAIALYGAHKAGDDLPEEEVAILGDLARNAALAY